MESLDLVTGPEQRPNIVLETRPHSGSRVAETKTEPVPMDSSYHMLVKFLWQYDKDHCYMIFFISLLGVFAVLQLKFKVQYTHIQHWNNCYVVGVIQSYLTA